MQERFCDGMLAEVALTPGEYRAVRKGSKRMRETLEWLRAAIAHPDFDGDTALAGNRSRAGDPGGEMTPPDSGKDRP